MYDELKANPRGALTCDTIIAEQYRVGAFVFADGEGLLYEAVRERDGTALYMKEYLPLTLSEDRTEDGTIRPKEGSEVLFKTTRMDFADLYRALQGITPCVGLETVVDVVECNNTVYAVTENLGGVSLSQYLQEQGGKLLPEQALALLKPIFAGVSEMHVVGLVHRGVCPENIMVTADGAARLTGYATIDLRTGGSALRAQLYEGYSAPEQYSAADFEGRYTDAYGLAAVYYYLITGRAPVSAGQRLVSDANPSARSVEPTVPSVLSDVLVSALQMKPAERIQTVTKLQRCLASADNARAFLAAQKRARKKKRGYTGIIGAVVIAICALICFGLWFSLSYDREPPEPLPTAQPTPTPEPVVVTADNFIGMTFAQVQESERYREGYLFYITEAYSANAPVGTIIEQTPAAGMPFEEGQNRIDLVVSLGPEMATVPDYLFGFTQEGAAKELESLGLTASFVMQLNDGSYASGCVVKTDPAAGREVKVGTTITVYIAADRDVEVIATPVPEPTPQVTAMPESTQTPTPVATPEPPAA